MNGRRMIARRAFLVASTAIIGGVAFGVYVVRRPHENPLAQELEPGEVTFNPWVKIGPDGITLIAPHSDLGQGVRSMQAALIAEELDLEFGQFDIEPGVPAAAYWNTASASEALPFLESDRGLVASSARAIANAALKMTGMQITGGSSSTPDSYSKLRLAGAVARETLKAAAARRFRLAVEELSTANGEVVLPNGESIAYTALAAEAAVIEPVQDVELRDPSSWRLLGKAMRREDIVAKSTGALKFGIDLALEGMVHATVRMNPYQGGELGGFDASRAETMPGVRQVHAIRGGVAVIADNTWNAMQAAAAVDVEWGDGPYPPGTDEHWARLSASFVEERLDREWRHDGDVPLALSSAEAPIQFEYRVPYLAHAPLEPLNALIRVGESDADIWVSHQIPRYVQSKVADIAGIEVDNVRVHNQYAGGSFGHRLEFLNVETAAEIAAQRRGTPVKLTFSREEDFAQDFHRPAGICRGAGVVGDGRVEALDIATASASSLRSQAGRLGVPAPGPDGQLAAGMWTAPYALPDFRVRCYRADELAPISSWRSVGASSGGFFIESAMDELIAAAGADALQERLRLCSDPVVCRVLETVGEMSRWGSDPGPDRGRGLALVISFGVPVAEVVEVTNTAAGIRIDKVWVAADVGRVLDPVNFENQVQGGVAWGLGHAMNCEITFSAGASEQANYHQFSALRLHQCPPIEVRGLENGETVRGIGEPPVPPAAPALANAIFAATGTRLRELPFNKTVTFA